MELVIEILRWAVFITGALDAYKYKFLVQKISRLKSSREISRKFINVSILKNLVLLVASVTYLNDWAVMWACIISLYTGCEAFYYVYLYYPYKTRGLKNFKRPPLWKYLWNSLLPNDIRERL